MTKEDVLKVLYENKDLKYKEFNDKIINTKLKTIGVRTPILKMIAKDISKGDYKSFLDNKFSYFEEIMIEGFVISYIKDPLETLKRLDVFLEKVDNWAICDMVSSSCKRLIKKEQEFYLFIKNNLKSNNLLKVRFSFVCLLNYFIKENYLNDIFMFLENDDNDFYYIMMAKAWLISACYIKYPKETIRFLKNTNIDKVTYNKAISKICDSKRVSREEKIMLRKMKK